jgi:hypothetical protein
VREKKCFVLYCFWQNWGLNSGLHAYETNALQLEPLPLALFALVILVTGYHFLPGPAWTSFLCFSTLLG